MTSPMTDKPTRDYIKQMNYFGLKADQAFFFSQGTLPCLTTEGKIMLETCNRVATAPDGK